MKTVISIVLVLCVGLVVAWPAQAQTSVRFTTSIAPGTLFASFRTSFGQQVDQPNVDFGRFVNSFDCRNADMAARATLGSDNQRMYVTNPKAARQGWVLSLAPQQPNTVWQGADSNEQMDFNDASGGGCIDGDGDGAAGLLSLNLDSARLSTDCLECSPANVSVMANGDVDFANQSSVTLLQANDKADPLGRWYLTDVNVKQTIPPAQEGDDYAINFVLTASAI